MKKIVYVLVYALFPAAVLCTGCSSFLEEYSQDTEYVKTWEDLDELLIGSCYLQAEETSNFANMQNVGMGLHLVGDELMECHQWPDNVGQSYNSHPRAFAYFTWQQRTGQNDAFTDFFAENQAWQKIYYCINVANNVLHSASKLPQDNEAQRQGWLKVTGEAHFLRAFYYFWLVNVYGKPYDPATAAADLGVPIKTSEEVLDVRFGRNSVEEVYRQVLSDLDLAENHLQQYSGRRASIYRADLNAVLLLRSRVALYMQNWDEAAQYASKVIDRHPQLSNLNTATGKFAVRDNPENIFSMGGDDLPGLLFFGAQGMQVDSAAYRSYAPNDLRRAQWFWTYGAFMGLAFSKEGNRYLDNDPTAPDYYFRAYSDGKDYQKAEVSSLFWLRSAEAYLNLAEAEAYRGNDQQARTALNALRRARMANGAADAEVTAAGNDLVRAIRNERRWEFLLQGQRWFDLRRYRVCGVLPQKTSITHDYTFYESAISATPVKRQRYTLTEEDASWTLPLPHEVVEFNGMPNNGNQWRTFIAVNIN